MRENNFFFIKIVFYTLACILVGFVCSKTYSNLTDLITIKRLDKKIEDIRLSHLPKEKKIINSFDYSRTISENILHRKYIRWLNNKPIVINIVNISPHARNINIKASYGSYFINNVKTVKDIANKENALVAINASYYNEDKVIPVGASIIDGEVVTGPIFNRVAFGVTDNNKYKIDKIKIIGSVNLEQNKLSLFNINQPFFSKKGFTVFTARWGRNTPKTSSAYSHVVVEKGMISYVKNSSVKIPRDGFVFVGLNKNLPKPLERGTKCSYNLSIVQKDWQNVKYAVSGGPYLIKEGRIFIDKQKFTKEFLWTKDSRTAIGYTKEGTLILLTVDAVRKGVSEGATIYELAKLMREIGAYEAINLDGGKSTQMVINGRLVNYPQVKNGNKVINALVIATSKISPVSISTTHELQNSVNEINKIIKNRLTSD